MSSKRAQTLTVVAALAVATALIVLLGRLSPDARRSREAPSLPSAQPSETVSARNDLEHDERTDSPAPGSASDEPPITSGALRTAAATVAPKFDAITVHGLVEDAFTYKPVVGATIESDDDPLPLRPRVLAHTDNYGTFDITGVAPGQLKLRLSAPNYLGTTQSAFISSNKPEARLIPALMTSAWSVTVRFLGPDGTPLGDWCRRNIADGKGVELSIFQTKFSPPKRLSLSSATRVGGTGPWQYLKPDWFSQITAAVNPPFPMFLSVGYFADARDPDHVQVVATQRADADGAVIVFTIPAEVFFPPLSRVRVCAVDAVSGAPIADARVGLNPRGTFGDAVQVTPPDGCVKFENIKHGRRYLTIIAKGYEWIQEEVDIADADVDLGVLRMSPSTRVTGHLFDESGPVSGVNVFAYALDKFDRAREIRSAFGSETKFDGSFELLSLGRGRYLVRVQDSGWASMPEVVDTTAGNVSDVTVHTSRGAELRIVVDESLPDATLCIATTGELPVAEFALTGVRELMQRLVPGDYEWRIDREDRRGDVHRFSVGDREDTLHVR